MARFPTGPGRPSQRRPFAHKGRTAMSLKLRGLGLAVLGTLAISAFGVVNASASVSGHFVHDAPDGHAMVNQTSTSGSTHQFVIKIDETAPIQCKQFSAFGTVTSPTVTQVQGTTTITGCRTEGSETDMLIHTNGCTGTGFSNSTGAVTGGLDCPAGKAMVVTHPNCTINVPPQANVTGFTPTTVTTSGKHAITLDVNIKYTVHYEGGICIFLGTSHTAFITGSTIIQGTDTNSQPINITST